jgi:serine/threonine protein phosphatase PrpC
MTIIKGATVRGKSHRIGKQPNQDAYAIKRLPIGTVMVVCDGIGSHQFSHLGSKAACHAVIQAVKQWVKSGNENESLLFYLIRILWELYVWPNTPNEAGTTCLFVIFFDDGRLFCAQLGDGLVCGRDSEGIFKLGESEKEFTNVTKSLVWGGHPEHWQCVWRKVADQTVFLALMTDGVSEELDLERLPEVLDYLQNITVTNAGATDTHWLRNELHALNTDVLSDDKTLIVCLRGE